MTPPKKCSPPSTHLSDPLFGVAQLSTSTRWSTCPDQPVAMLRTGWSALPEYAHDRDHRHPLPRFRRRASAGIITTASSPGRPITPSQRCVRRDARPIHSWATTWTSRKTRLRGPADRSTFGLVAPEPGRSSYLLFVASWGSAGGQPDVTANACLADSSIESPMTNHRWLAAEVTA